MMLLSDSLSMVTVAMIPLLYATDRLSFPLLLCWSRWGRPSTRRARPLVRRPA
jgi:hypothetical protein